MSFSSEVYLFSFFVLVFAVSFMVFGLRTQGVSRTLLLLFSLSFFVLTVFGVMVGLAFGVEYSDQSPCENVINSTNTSGNVTTYTYVDSCASSSPPVSVERLYVAYSYLVYLMFIVASLAVMFWFFKAVIFKW